MLPAEITGWADFVLPESTYLERCDEVHTPEPGPGHLLIFAPVGQGCENAVGFRLACAAGSEPGHVFNLGHGIHKDTPIESVELLVDFVREETSR